MTLIYDDYLQVYIWVDVDDHDNDLSPHFDDQEGALKWYSTVSAHMLSEFGITGDNNGSTT
jgi:hypothetical protein